MKSDNDFFPLGASHAPYWRAKSADPSEWEDDLKKMKNLGMTCVSVFASWHRIEQEEGKFDFSELDLIFDLAAKTDLKITIGLGVHIGYSIYPPRWIMRKYDKAGMVDQNGRPDVEGSYVQPCFEEEEYRAYAERYFKTLVRRYARHPALIQWRVWGEATLSNYCWCETHQRMFREYLRDKYESLENLNRVWGSEGPSGYLSFDEIYPPKKQYRFYGYHERLDWQDFLDRSLTEAVKRVNGWVKSEDENHMTLGEFWLPEDNSSGGGDDIWRLAKTSDALGLSIFNKPARSCAKDMDLMCSAARLNNKEAWVIEIQGGPKIFSAGWDEPYTPTAEQSTLWMWQFIAHGAKGIFYWTWRPRVSDIEGGELGIARRDGSLSERALAMGDEFRLLQKLSMILRSAKRNAEIAIVVSRKAEHLAAIDRIDRADKSYYTKSVYSAHELLWKAGYAADFVGELNYEYLKRYKVLILPFMFCVNRENVAVLKQYVEEGGVVIADFMLGAKDHGGDCDFIIPGFGLSELFGIAEDDILNGTGKTFDLSNGGILHVNHYVQTCLLRGGKAFGFYEGKAVCTRNVYGKGAAYFLGTVFFHRDGWLEHEANAEFFYALLKSLGIEREVAFRCDEMFDGDAPECAVLDTECGDKIVFLLNHSGKGVSGTLSVNVHASSVSDLRSGKPLAFTMQNGKIDFPASAHAKQCNIYQVTVKQ